LTAGKYKSLREETRIGFAPSIPDLFTSTQKISLPLDLKNTPSLLIRIYQIESRSSTESASFDLDGLVPHHSRTLTFAQVPLVLHRENIDLPELAGAGTWIVEFVSDRISARAMVRKGNITPHVARTAEGQSLRLFDEKAQPLKDFELTLGSETFTTTDGLITVPNAPNQPVISGTLTAGKLSTEISLASRDDSYSLETDFFLDREQLLANQQATLRLRTQLTNHGQPAKLELLKNPVLILKAKLQGGVTTERTIADPLPLAATNEIPFLVPADLLSLTLTLSGTVTPATSGEEQTLTQSTTYQLNGALESSRIATALFSPTAAGNRMFLRGRNGEPLADRPVNLKLFHKRYKKPVDVSLRTDASGSIELGPLFGITRLIATSPDIAATTYQHPAKKNYHPHPIHRSCRADSRNPTSSTFRWDRSCGSYSRTRQNRFPTDCSLTHSKLSPARFALPTISPSARSATKCATSSTAATPKPSPATCSPAPATSSTAGPPTTSIRRIKTDAAVPAAEPSVA